MYSLNKKGLADIITAITLIMFSTIAAVMLAGFANNLLFSSEVQLSSEYNCLDYQTALSARIIKACYNVEKKDIELDIETKVSGPKITQLDFTIIKDGESIGYSCSNACGNCEVQNAGSTKTYYFTSENFESGKAIAHVSGCRLDEKDIQLGC